MVAKSAAILEKARESFHAQSWGAAYEHFSAADREAPLAPEDLQWLAVAAHLTGRDTDSANALTRAHQGFLAQGDTQSAARCAFWLGFELMNNGELAQAGGWLARAGRLLEEHRHECVEQGYLLLPAAIRFVHEGDFAAAYQAFVRASAIGQRFGDTDLITAARMGQGRALIRQGEVNRGLSLLDEAMVAVTSGEVSPVMAGGVYCSVLEACGDILDLRRAQEWTTALERWHASQPDLVPFRGHCLLRRAEILQLHGNWQEAWEQAQQACERLSQAKSKAVLGAAIYRVAELHRLRGEFNAAEEAYRKASQWERAPQPGLAQLRLAQGQLQSANTAIRNVAESVREPGQRARVLDAYVEVVLSVNDLPAAETAAAELAQIAERLHAPMVQAMSSRAEGRVLFARKEVRESLGALRRSLTTWLDLEAPYEAARTRVLVALASRALEDHETANQELGAAREQFEKLGAAPNVKWVGDLMRKPARDSGVSSLSPREVEVLKLVASGMTNRGIAGKLRISEKTVARHVSNIFNKLDLSSRAAATAYAYRQKII